MSILLLGRHFACLLFNLLSQLCYNSIEKLGLLSLLLLTLLELPLELPLLLLHFFEGRLLAVLELSFKFMDALVGLAKLKQLVLLSIYLD